MLTKYLMKTLSFQFHHVAASVVWIIHESPHHFVKKKGLRCQCYNGWTVNKTLTSQKTQPSHMIYNHVKDFRKMKVGRWNIRKSINAMTKQSIRFEKLLDSYWFVSHMDFVYDCFDLWRKKKAAPRKVMKALSFFQLGLEINFKVFFWKALVN